MLDPELKVQVIVLLVCVLVRLPFVRVIKAMSWESVSVMPALLPVPLVATEKTWVVTVLVVSTSPNIKVPVAVLPEELFSVMDPDAEPGALIVSVGTSLVPLMVMFSVVVVRAGKPVRESVTV